MRSSFKNNPDHKELLNEIVSLAHSNHYFSLSNSKLVNLYSFSDVIIILI